MISVTHHTIGDVCISDTCSMLMAMACDMATECLQGEQHDPQGAERNLVPILSRLGQRHGKKNHGSSQSSLCFQLTVFSIHSDENFMGSCPNTL